MMSLASIPISIENEIVLHSSPKIQPATPPGNYPGGWLSPQITRAEKEILLKNLQLELERRTELLRCQYAVHSESLRARLEMRVSRVPKRLRNMKIGDLLATLTHPTMATTGTTTRPTPSLAGTKRPSSTLVSSDRKFGVDENDNTIVVVKKRLKTSTTATTTPLSPKPRSQTISNPQLRQNNPEHGSANTTVIAIPTIPTTPLASTTTTNVAESTILSTASTELSPLTSSFVTTPSGLAHISEDLDPSPSPNVVTGTATLVPVSRTGSAVKVRVLNVKRGRTTAPVTNVKAELGPATTRSSPLVGVNTARNSTMTMPLSYVTTASSIVSTAPSSVRKRGLRSRMAEMAGTIVAAATTKSRKKGDGVSGKEESKSVKKKGALRR